MEYTYAILGAGRQGVAAAYDLILHGDAKSIDLFDVNAQAARHAAERLNRLSGQSLCHGQSLDVSNRTAATDALTGHDAALSAVPYRFNILLTDAALDARTPLCDLGGSTTTVFAQMERGTSAKRRKVAIVPDCGLAPGTANVMARYLVERLEAAGAKPEEVRLYCGGLPQHPEPPLGYQMVFSIEGLLKEYTAPCHVLRGGKVQQVEPLTEVESLTLPAPVGQAEAFHTSGGASTGPWSFEKRLDSYEYKTVRYPGHAAAIEMIKSLGLLDDAQVQVGKARVSPRELFQTVVPERLTKPEAPDLVILRAIGRGTVAASGPLEIVLEWLDLKNEATGFTAMERTTGFSAAVVMHLLAREEVEPGVAPPEQSLPAADYLKALSARGFRIEETIRRPFSSE